jgi:beta-fructofuranosidase
MSLELPNVWAWDFWVAQDGADYHLFFLQADRALGDPERRHWHASIGHAVSRDLTHWDYDGACFYPAAPPAWDDGTTWTGSIIRHDGLWYFFYTGTRRSEDKKKQRIGLATSSDLCNWRRHDLNPVVDLDPAHYEEYDPTLWHDRSLRDPWVARDPSGEGFRMWFTARAPIGPGDGRGVIGTATSPDLERWTVGPAVTVPGDFGEVEVPQFAEIGGRFYLFFCTSAARTSAKRRATLAREGRQPETGTHYFMADRPEGPWRLGPLPFLSSLYAGRVVTDPDGRPCLLGFIGADASGTFRGAISDPHPIIAGADGSLRLDPPAAGGDKQSAMPTAVVAAAV